MFPLPRFPSGLWRDNTRLMDAFMLCVKWAELCAALCRHTCSRGHDSTAWPSNEGSQKQAADRELPQTAAPGLGWAAAGWAAAADAQRALHSHALQTSLFCSRTNPSKHTWKCKPGNWDLCYLPTALPNLHPAAPTEVLSWKQSF